MGSPWYKIMLGMSYYIHAGGLGALVDGARPDSKGLARAARPPLTASGAPSPRWDRARRAEQFHVTWFTFGGGQIARGVTRSRRGIGATDPKPRALPALFQHLHMHMHMLHLSRCPAVHQEDVPS